MDIAANNNEVSLIDMLQHKINKYRIKSSTEHISDESRKKYESRLMYYMAQNRGVQQSHPSIIYQNGGANSVRKGPEQSATLYKVGTKKEGNDGNKWEIVETNAGVKRWKLYKKTNNASKIKIKSKSKSKNASKIKSKNASKIKSKTKSKTKSKSKSKSRSVGHRRRKRANERNEMSKEIIEKFKNLGTSTKSFIPKNKLTSRPREYLIHDNGGRPFKVVATNKGLDVFTFVEPPEDEYIIRDKKGKVTTFIEYEPVYDKLILSLKKFKGYWVGFDTSPYVTYHGNSLLVQETKTSYVFIGLMIFRFTTEEEILDYVSPVGNNDVPYPIAYTKNYVYFMLNDVYANKTDFITKDLPIQAENMYGEFFGHLHPENHKNIKQKKMKGKKMLVKRKW